MAKVYRPSYWVKDGKKARANEPGAKLRTLSKWYGVIRFADGSRRPIPLCPDKSIAQVMLTRLQSEEDSKAAGVPVVPLLPKGNVVLLNLLPQWEAHLKEKDDTPLHVKQHTRRVRHLLEDIGSRVPTSTQVSSYLSERRAGKKDFGHGIRGKLSARTSNYYLSAYQSFLAFVRSPALDLQPLPIREDGRLRRVLLPTDFQTFLQVVRASSWVWRSLTGEDRYWLYLIAAHTGLRAQELASLELASFDAHGITVTSKRAKNRRRATIPLPKDLAEPFKTWAVKRSGALWPLSWWRKASNMVRHDLTEAGLPYQDGQGKYADFHSLRAFFATSLARAGVPLQQAQRLLRHSSPALTANLYTKLEQSDLQAASEAAFRALSVRQPHISVHSSGKKEKRKKRE